MLCALTTDFAFCFAYLFIYRHHRIFLGGLIPQKDVFHSFILTKSIMFKEKDGVLYI